MKTITVVNTSDGRICSKVFRTEASTFKEFCEENNLNIDLNKHSVYSECGQRNLTDMLELLPEEESSKLYISRNKMISSGLI